MSLRIKFQKVPGLLLTRNALGAQQLVYIGRASRQLSYPYGKSSIVYIGTTKNGLVRIAGSAAWKADELLDQHGIQSVAYHIVTCAPLSPLKTWRLLERALIIRFRELYGKVPFGNDQFKNAHRGREFHHFSQHRIDEVLREFSDSVFIDWE